MAAKSADKIRVFKGGLQAYAKPNPILYGTCTNPEHLKLSDATWDERHSGICLTVAVAGMGLAPLWVSDLVREGVTTVITHLMN